MNVVDRILADKKQGRDFTIITLSEISSIMNVDKLLPEEICGQRIRYKNDEESSRRLERCEVQELDNLSST